MNTTQAAWFGALIGGIFALTGVVITNVVALRNERLRQEAGARTARIEALRRYAGLAFGEFFSAQHSIEWITWYAVHDSDALNDEFVKSYDDEIHRAFPKMVAAMAMVASLDLDAYGRMRPILDRLYQLEAYVAREVRRLSTNRAEAVTRLARHLEEATELEKVLPPELGQVMQAAEVKLASVRSER
jgi:hypothetical protein